MPATLQHGHRALGDEANDDGQDDEAHDVVGHRGAENDASLGRRQRPKIAEHASGDADARRRQRGRDEQRRLEVVADDLHGAETQHAMA